VDSGSGYNSQNDMPVHFGLASADPVDVAVTIPLGGRRLTRVMPGVRPADWHGRVVVVRTGSR
jgi:hypothetical protein